MGAKDFERAIEYRGKSFARNLETYKMLTRLKPPKEAFDEKGQGKVKKLTFYLIKLRSERFLKGT